VVPDSSKRLADGWLIETFVLARLFGIKLLTLEGTVAVTPAQPRELSTGHSVSRDSIPVSPVYDVSRGPRRAQHRLMTTAPALPTERLGIRLAEAVRLLHDSAGCLEGLGED
jgi:hypothetical protein